MRPLLPQYHVYRRRKDCILKKSSGPLQFTKWILSSKNISGVHHHCVYRFSCLETLNTPFTRTWNFSPELLFAEFRLLCMYVVIHKSEMDASLHDLKVFQFFFLSLFSKYVFGLGKTRQLQVTYWDELYSEAEIILFWWKK